MPLSRVAVGLYGAIYENFHDFSVWYYTERYMISFIKSDIRIHILAVYTLYRSV